MAIDTQLGSALVLDMGGWLQVPATTGTVNETLSASLLGVSYQQGDTDPEPEVTTGHARRRFIFVRGGRRRRRR